MRDAKNKENERKKNLPVLLLLEHQSRQSAAKAAKQIARPCPDSYNKNKRHEKKKKKKKKKFWAFLAFSCETIVEIEEKSLHETKLIA